MAAAPARRGGGGLSLCLISAGIVKTLSLAAFTLAWIHSVERIDWQEDWRITPQGLELVQARIKGSGAGMEPAPGARSTAGFNGNQNVRRCRRSCGLIPAPPVNGDCATMANAGHCRIFSGIRSVLMSR
jgi:hypothetical protein